MDIELLLAERRRVADEHRAAAGCVREVKKTLDSVLTVQERMRTEAALASISEEATTLSDRLLQLEASVSAAKASARD